MGMSENNQPESLTHGWITVLLLAVLVGSTVCFLIMAAVIAKEYPHRNDTGNLGWGFVLLFHGSAGICSAFVILLAGIGLLLQSARRRGKVRKKDAADAVRFPVG
jgi:hypothetical protein